MTAVKLQKFAGKAPRVAPELLGDTAAQVATNVKLYSGDLIPYPKPVAVGDHGLTGSRTVTLHALRNPTTSELEWLAWDRAVNIVTPAGDDAQDEQRFYYTGDAGPKVSTYDLATAGAKPYPVGYYDLGLPLPDDQPVATARAFNTLTSASYSRDAAGQVTLVTSTPHGLKSGAFVSVYGFTYRSMTYSQSGTTITVTLAAHALPVGSRVFLEFTSGTAVTGFYAVTGVPSVDTFEVQADTSATTSGGGRLDITDLNGDSIEITVTADDTLTYFSPGGQVGSVISAAGKIDLAGATQARTYLYTFYTRWSEESVGSLPSEPIFIREGQTVDISGLPVAPPAGANQIQGLRLYRTLSSTSDTEYLLLATLWYPVPLATYKRVNNVATFTSTQPHNLSVGSFFKTADTGLAAADITGGEVLSAPDIYTFTCADAGADVAETDITNAGVSRVYHDVSEELGTAPAAYWGDATGSGYDFVDDFKVQSLGAALGSDDYDPPPASLAGLTEVNNSFLAGFVGNELYFSEPGQYHAWPRRYKKSVAENIVGLATFSSYLIVLTDGYPYIVQGSDPAILSLARIDARYPCLNARSIANMGFGIMYATHDGLAVYSTRTGPQLATRLVYNSDTWKADLDPSTLLGAAYKDTYLGWHSAGGISFERNNDDTGGFFVDLETAQPPTATWYDSTTNNLYYASGTDGTVFQWDDLSQPSEPYEWKSKMIEVDTPMNIGAAQINADFSAVSPQWETLEDTWDASPVVWDNDGAVTFILWVDKEEVFRYAVTSDHVLRLPAGYRSDRFEVGVEASVRVKSIRLAETPTGLKRV